MRVKSYKAKRGNKTVAVKQHNKKEPRGRAIKSSFLDRVQENENGGYSVIIRGKAYPYPYLPDSKISGVISGRGKFYNKNIKGKYF